MTDHFFLELRGIFWRRIDSTLRFIVAEEVTIEPGESTSLCTIEGLGIGIYESFYLRCSGLDAALPFITGAGRRKNADDIS